MTQTKNFQVGDVVRLKSGGPRMTVTSLGRDGDVYCAYFMGGKPQYVQFVPSALEMAPRPDRDEDEHEDEY